MSRHPIVLAAMKADRRRLVKQRTDAEASLATARKRNQRIQVRDLTAYVERRDREIAAHDRLIGA